MLWNLDFSLLMVNLPKQRLVGLMALGYIMKKAILEHHAASKELESVALCYQDGELQGINNE